MSASTTTSDDSIASASEALPIERYEELTVAQVANQLAGLRPPELRRVRDYERRHGNREPLLAAIEEALG